MTERQLQLQLPLGEHHRLTKSSRSALAQDRTNPQRRLVVVVSRLDDQVSHIAKAKAQFRSQFRFNLNFSLNSSCSPLHFLLPLLLAPLAPLYGLALASNILVGAT
jgi:hypothetical protein